jgi:hypothetical protein
MKVNRFLMPIYRAGAHRAVPQSLRKSYLPEAWRCRPFRRGVSEQVRAALRGVP